MYEGCIIINQLKLETEQWGQAESQTVNNSIKFKTDYLDVTVHKFSIFLDHYYVV